MESHIDYAFENVVSELSTLDLAPNLNPDCLAVQTEVGKLASHNGDAKKTEEMITTALQKSDLTPLDKAYLEYQLARCQMFGGQQKEADETFRRTLPLIEALDPKRPDMLSAAYYGYSLCLDKQGKVEESRSYKAKYQALVDEAKKRNPKDRPEGKEE